MEGEFNNDNSNFRTAIKIRRFIFLEQLKSISNSVASSLYKFIAQDWIPADSILIIYKTHLNRLLEDIIYEKS